MICMLPQSFYWAFLEMGLHPCHSRLCLMVEWMLVVSSERIVIPSASRLFLSKCVLPLLLLVRTLRIHVVINSIVDKIGKIEEGIILRKDKWV